MSKTRSRKSRKSCPPKWILSHITSLTRELADCDEAERRDEIRKQLSDLRNMTDQFSPKANVSVPLPKSYIEARRAKIEAAARISGRKTIRVRFVQGGAPGSGRGGKRQ